MTDHVYMLIKEIDLNNPLWVRLVDGILEWDVVTGENQYNLQKRGNLDTFVWVADDPETLENEEVTYSKGMILEARWEAGQLTVDNVGAMMAEIFDKPPENITYGVTKVTYVDRRTSFIKYSYNDVERVEFAVFGAVSANDIPGHEESRIEAAGYIAANNEEWNGVAL